MNITFHDPFFSRFSRSLPMLISKTTLNPMNEPSLKSVLKHKSEIDLVR